MSQLDHSSALLYLYREFDIHLETNTDIFLPEFKVYSVGKDGERTSTTSYQTKNTVRGFVEGRN